jgi:HAD superfamily hydrolase (TIGR01549 family)
VTTYDTVLLDVDGTLIDSNPWHVAAWQQAFAELGHRQPAWRIQQFIGMGGDRLVGAVAGDDVEDAVGDDARSLWKERYDGLIENVRPLPGAADLVRALKERGFRVVLASSGKPDHLEYARKHLGVDHLLDGVTTGDDVDSTKPSGELFRLALESAGGRDAVVVGDTPWDVRAAQDVDAPTIGVRCGGFDPSTLLGAGAVAVFDDPADLTAALDRTPLRAR